MTSLDGAPALLLQASLAALAAVLAHALALRSTARRLSAGMRSGHERRILGRRHAVYRELWAHLEPLALYAPPAPVTQAALETLSAQLRHWYFHRGGIYLSRPTQRAYLTLQDELQAVIKRQDLPAVLREASDLFTDADKAALLHEETDAPERLRLFARLADAGSALRSSMTRDLETRAFNLSPEDSPHE